MAADWPTAHLGPKDVWEAATDRSAQTRFIPMQLIVPGAWDGARRIDLPAAVKAEADGTVWSGPLDWLSPQTGRMLRVYDRSRTTGREGRVEQKMALRSDGSAIGRVYDSRFGGITCDQEGKFPLGVWKQGEVRTFEYACMATRGGRLVERRRASRMTMVEINYEYAGIPHSLRIAWRFTDRDSGEILDHRTYVFSPGRGLVSHARR